MPVPSITHLACAVEISAFARLMAQRVLEGLIDTYTAAGPIGLIDLEVMKDILEGTVYATWPDWANISGFPATHSGFWSPPIPSEGA